MAQDALAPALRLIARLVELARSDQELHTNLRLLGEALIELAGPDGVAAASGTEPSVTSTTATAVVAGSGPISSIDTLIETVAPTTGPASTATTPTSGAPLVDAATNGSPEPQTDGPSVVITEAEAETTHSIPSSEVATSTSTLERAPSHAPASAHASAPSSAPAPSAERVAPELATSPEPPSDVAELFRRAPADEDLPTLEAALRLKAAGARWAVERHGLIAAGVDVRDRDHELLARARDAGVHLWTNSSRFTLATDGTLEQLADAFATTAGALALARATSPGSNGDRERRVESLRLLAAAQSALRVAMTPYRASRDPDADRVFAWLKAVCFEERIYLDRHMRLDDPADPAELPAIAGRIGAMRAELTRIAEHETLQERRWSQLAYHVGLITHSRGSLHDWQKVVAVVDQMVAEGLPPSNVRLRSLLGPTLEHAPKMVEVPAGFARVVRDIEAASAPRRPVNPSKPSSRQTTSDEIAAVRARLEGTSVVMIGGLPKPEARAALAEAYGLRELVWLPTKPHQSLDILEPAIARADIRLVLVLLRWSSHDHGRFDELCEHHGRILVRISAGYNPARVARAIVTQRGRQLGIASASMNGSGRTSPS